MGVDPTGNLCQAQAPHLYHRPRRGSEDDLSRPQRRVMRLALGIESAPLLAAPGAKTQWCDPMTFFTACDFQRRVEPHAVVS